MRPVYMGELQKMTGLELSVACLALNVFFEGANEPAIGQYAIALVTMNRAKEGNLDVCDVVFEPKQFSWADHALDANGKLLPQYLPSGAKWQNAREVARQVMFGKVGDFTQGATYYHADYIAKPKWARGMRMTGKFGVHYFYRRAG